MLSGQPQAVIVLSDEARAYHTLIGYQPQEWVLIPIGIDTQMFVPDLSARSMIRHELGLNPDVPLIGLVARFDPVKGHRTFLQAAGLLGEQWREVHFVLVGPGITADNETLRESVETSGVRGRVHLLGVRQDLPRVTAALDIATSSSYSEGFGTVIGEAMACAVPCVVTDVGAPTSIVGDTGRIVPPKDARALAKAWQELLELGPKRRQELGRQARAEVEAQFGLDCIVRQYESLYERLAKAR
jgi:glycosyltransferase involved in cell wall biosynthesis